MWSVECRGVNWDCRRIGHAKASRVVQVTGLRDFSTPGSFYSRGATFRRCSPHPPSRNPGRHALTAHRTGNGKLSRAVLSGVCYNDPVGVTDSGRPTAVVGGEPTAVGTNTVFQGGPSLQKGTVKAEGAATGNSAPCFQPLPQHRGCASSDLRRHSWCVVLS